MQILLIPTKKKVLNACYILCYVFFMKYQEYAVGRYGFWKIMPKFLNF